MENSNLFAAWLAINAGKIIDVNGCRVWRAWSENGRRFFIFWRSYGSSAERDDISGLAWIFETFGGSCDASWTVVPSIY